MSRNYKFNEDDGLYFVSFATVYWVDVFVRQIYFESVVKNLNFCIANKGMEIYAWCIMPSHIHLVFRSTIQKPADLLRDFKSFTSKELIQLIKDNTQESRREWLINSFKKAATTNSNNANYQFWQQHNQPIILWSADVINQKIDYIHNNPVVSGFVDDAKDYLHSSARDYCDIKGLVNVVLANAPQAGRLR